LSLFEPSTYHTLRGRSQIAVWEVGEGQPVLCIHGFPDHAISLRPLAEALAQGGYRAVCPALPGYWPSHEVPDNDYAIPAVAKDMLELMDQLGAAHCALIGHDWGAEIAYYLGAHHPDRLTGIVALSAPHPAGFRTRREVFSEQMSAWYAIFLAYSPAAPAIASQMTWLTALAQSWSPGFFWQDWPSVASMIARPDVMQVICRYYRDDLVHDLNPGIVRVPTTVIHGGQDGALSPTLFAGLNDWFGAGVVQHLLPACGHWPHLESPEQVLPMILDALGQSLSAEPTAATRGDANER
jgi:pimeloyl-ACP methyl ester carboxylesterase